MKRVSFAMCGLMEYGDWGWMGVGDRACFFFFSLVVQMLACEAGLLRLFFFVFPILQCLRILIHDSKTKREQKLKE